MSGLSARERGDLAEAMLPVAANLAVLVHGEGGPEDVAETLAGLSEQQRTALIVVLAGLVNPEQSLGDALGWLDFNEHGALTVPSWSEDRQVRDLVPDDGPDAGDGFIDDVAVERYLAGARVAVSDEERLLAVVRGVERGVTYPDIDAAQGLLRGSTSTFISRLRKRYAVQGRAFPVLKHAQGTAVLTDEQVVEMRELYAAGGITDLEISMRYGLARKTVTSVLSGVSHRNAGGPIRARRGSRPAESSRREFNGHTGFEPEAVQAS